MRKIIKLKIVIVIAVCVCYNHYAKTPPGRLYIKKTAEISRKNKPECGK